MKIAVVYNRDSKNVINLFGMPNHEKIGRKTIKRITDALKKGGHQVVALEGDKDLVEKLEEFMPRVVHGERPGMVFNVSYGIQGQARYTHVPSILEMVGIPYVASGPLAHSLALDKVVTKVMLKQHGLPTPEFAVIESPDADIPELPYPMVVKPKNEAVSFGLAIVNDEPELREKADVIFKKFRQAVLAEQYIEGREINVGLLGNNPPEALPPVELTFGVEGPPIYTYEDKIGRSGREISFVCPAPIGHELTEQAENMARRAFVALGIADCARVDMRLDEGGNLYILEVNSLPSLGEHGSYLVGAAQAGLDFTGVVNRIVEVASARYFGTPVPPVLEPRKADVPKQVFAYITQRRESLERRLGEWVQLSSRTGDALGLEQAARRLDTLFSELGMKPVDGFTHPPETTMWETAKGFEGGTILVGHLDVPVTGSVPHQPFRREAEWLYGEGVGTSRAPLVMLEFALRSLRSLRRLRRLKLGVLFHTDEGLHARRSTDTIRAAARKAKRVLVLAPGTLDNGIVTRRRGHRQFEFRVNGEGRTPGRRSKRAPLLRWMFSRLEAFEELTSVRKKVSVSTLAVSSWRHPMRLPHRATATLLLTYLDARAADEVEQSMRQMLSRGPYRSELVLQADRPPKPERVVDKRLARDLRATAQEWQIPLRTESSVWPSVAGLVPPKVASVCGVGPVSRERGTPEEAVLRISLVQRTLLLAEYLASLLPKK